MPISYPATESGVEIRILKHLFTPQEAEIALQLSRIPEPVERINKRVKKSGMSIEELENILDEMARKGNIIPGNESGKKLYSNAPFAVGMYEFQVDRLTQEFAHDCLQYFDEAYDREAFKSKINQLRTIPVEKSIPVPEKYLVSQYDSVRQIIEDSGEQFGVANCVCRQSMDLVGKSCTVTDLRETCLLISKDAVDYYTGVGIGRAISKEEALDILEKAQEAGLVIQPLNSLRPEAICCCCGDCCGILTSLKKFPRPADYYASNFYAVVDPNLCTGCQICTEKCQMEAAVMSNGTAAINLDRCIGCGNCVVNCESNAIQLKKKEVETVPPKDMNDMQIKILSRKVGKLNLLKMGAKAWLKQKV
jgi:NAD-dependent dihydropyrimidine dehydrogenase PreA subunit